MPSSSWTNCGLDRMARYVGQKGCKRTEQHKGKCSGFDADVVERGYPRPHDAGDQSKVPAWQHKIFKLEFVPDTDCGKAFRKRMASEDTSSVSGDSISLMWKWFRKGWNGGV